MLMDPSSVLSASRRPSFCTDDSVIQAGNISVGSVKGVSPHPTNDNKEEAKLQAKPMTERIED